VLQADEKEDRCAREEDEVDRNLHARDLGEPLERRWEDADDQRERACDEPPDGMTLLQPPSAEHLDDNAEGEQRRDDPENIAGDAHAEITCLG
jgi:hypothetical protein